MFVNPDWNAKFRDAVPHERIRAVAWGNYPLFAKILISYEEKNEKFYCMKDYAIFFTRYQNIERLCHFLYMLSEYRKIMPFSLHIIRLNLSSQWTLFLNGMH